MRGLGESSGRAFLRAGMDDDRTPSKRANVEKCAVGRRPTQDHRRGDAQSRRDSGRQSLTLAYTRL